MDGELAQIIALVAHGNVFFAKRSGEPLPPLQQSNSTFQRVSAVVFARYRDRHQERGETFATSVSEWLSLLKSIGVRQLWNIAFEWTEDHRWPEYVAKAFAGAVPRAIQADLPSGFELWYPQWKIGGPSEKPWTVEYRSLMFPNSHRRLPIDLMLIKSELRFAIQRAIRFAWKSGTDLEKWGDWLEHALPLLDDANPVAPFHPDMLPEEGYSLLARQILAAAAQADVFHGMGSWNDVSFQDTHFQREYRSVSEQLYEAFKLATVMVPNSFENGTQGI